jgi:hypothetical protein
MRDAAAAGGAVALPRRHLPRRRAGAGVRGGGAGDARRAGHAAAVLPPRCHAARGGAVANAKGSRTDRARVFRAQYLLLEAPSRAMRRGAAVKGRGRGTLAASDAWILIYVIIYTHPYICNYI